MKKIYVILLISIFIFGCSSNSNDEVENSFTGFDTNFSKVYLGNLGQRCFGCVPEQNSFELSFLSESISINENNGETLGIGALMRLNFISEKQGLPKAGIYKISDTLPNNLIDVEFRTSKIDSIDFSTPYYEIKKFSFYNYKTSQFEISYNGTQIIIEYDLKLKRVDHINFNYQENPSGNFEEELNLKGKWDGNITIIQNKLF